MSIFRKRSQDQSGKDKPPELGIVSDAATSSAEPTAADMLTTQEQTSNADLLTQQSLQTGVQPDIHLQAEELRRELEQNIEGEVRFSVGDRALYATDASNYRQVPIGVVLPKSELDIRITIAACRKLGVPILSRGGGTSLCGQCCNVAVVMDMSKHYNELIELDYEQKTAIVQPGLVLDSLRNKAEEHHLTFAPDPSTHNHCTLGGMIGNNSCGTHSVMGGTTSDNLIEMDIVLYDGTKLTVGETTDEQFEKIIAEGGRKGEIYRKIKDFRDKYADLIRAKFPKLKRRVSGYNLPALLPENGCNIAKVLCGSEATLVTILQAKLRLVDSPPKRSLLVLGYPDVFSAGDHVTELMKFGPIALEGLDDLLVDFMKKKHLHPERAKLLPDGGGWLAVEFGGDTKEESDAKARKAMDKLKSLPDAPSMKLYDDPEEEYIIWKVRESGLGATARVPGQKDTWEGWEDSAVPPEHLGDYLRALRELLNKYDYKPVALYGHFGQGCVHCRIPFDLKTVAGVEHWRSFLDEAADLVISFGGSISGEHGDGQSKANLLPKMFGNEMIAAFEEFKSIWDPDWKMNPGKIVKPNEISSNLRLGPHYSPWAPETHFQFVDDENSLPRATTRCVGVGECRRLEGGTMCPSYMATREEMHSTRGRAHLLFEMLDGQLIQDGWRDENVKEALDLCLACKGCKSDCPVNVDMATLKSEFLSHYYDKRLRPRNAYVFGLIHIWARIASHIPNIVNFFARAPYLSSIAKTVANADQSRTLPKFATTTFKQWFANRPPRNAGKPEVVLFPDTFNDFFHPDTGKAAVEILEDAGFHVIVPQADMCCGRPLYDYGMLYAAKRWLNNAITVLKPYIEGGLPIVFLEPSCLAVFRDEMRHLLADNEDAKRLENQSYAFSEFIVKKAPDYEIPKLNRKALLQVHCHHKSVIDPKDHKELLEKMQADAEIPEPGCCGMAGAFGFEEGSHCQVSTKIAEQRLLPSVRNVPLNQVITADGFSCREQIEQGSDRRALHSAELIKLAKEDVNNQSPYPEEIVLKEEGWQLTGTEKILISLATVSAMTLVWGLFRSGKALMAGKKNK